jgi:hypothetical protein
VTVADDKQTHPVAPEPGPAAPQDDDALPVRLPTVTPRPSPFSLAEVDYHISQHLADLIPAQANRATVSLRVVGEDGKGKILTGVLATKVAVKRWNVDLGAAAAGSVDLDNLHNFRAEFLGVVDWK